MKKALSVFLALIMILSIGTVGVSANDYVWIYTSRLGAKVENYLYFPVYYDDDGYFYGDEDTKIKITFPFTYDPEILKPVEVTPSELLYGMNFESEISRVDVYSYIDEYGVEITYPYFYADITFDGDKRINKGEILFNVKMEIVGETTSNSGGPIFDSFFLVEDLEQEKMTCCKWEVVDGNGNVIKDISSKIQHNYRLDIDDTDDNLILNNYEPFIPPVEETPLFKTGVTEKHIRKENAVYYPIRFDGGEGVSYAQFRSSVTGKETGVCRTRAVMKFIYDANTVEFIDTIASIGLHFFSGETKVLERGSTGETGPDGQEYDYIVVELNVGNINISDDYSFFYLKFYVLEENFLTDDGRVRTVVANADYEKAPDSKGCIWQFNDDNGVICDLSTRVYLHGSSDYPEVSSYNDLLIDEVLTGDLWETGLSLTTKITPAHGRIDNFVYYPCEFIPGKYYSSIVRNMTGFDDGSTQVKMKISYDARVLEFIDVLPSKELYDIGGTLTVIESGVMNPEQTYFEYVIIQVDFDGFTGLDDKYLYSLKFNVLEEKFVNSSGRPISHLTMERFSIDGVWSQCHWTVTGTNGRQFDLTELTASKSTASFDSTISYDDLIIAGYEPFDPTLIGEEKFEIIGNATVMTQGKVNYIVGLQPSLTKAKFQSTYISSENVTVEINMTTARYMGTGSTVTVKSEATDEVIAEYTIIIYGDIDGSATINARDAVEISNSMAGITDSLTGAAKFAANVEGTRTAINAKDADVIDAVVAGTMVIDQTTGKGVEI